MIDTDELNAKFSLEGELGFMELDGDLPFIAVSNKYAEADICLYGAHITRFKPHKGAEVLWMSPLSSYEVGSPIRGGIPVCFPWFGPHKTEPEKPQHGFGRLMYWDVLETTSLPTGETLIRLGLGSSDATRAYWANDFEAEMIISVGITLKASLKVTNTSKQAFDYTCALHSYFNISAIENIKIEGLQNTAYHNQLQPGDFKQEEELLTITKAETRHYYNTEATCVIDDPVFRRRIQIAKSGSKLTTVWNPGAETCANIADLPDDAYHAFVCLETVNAYEDVISLAPGESHETITMISLEG